MIQLTHFDSEDDYYIAQIVETSVTVNSYSPIFRTTVCGPWSGRPLVQPVLLCDVMLLCSYSRYNGHQSTSSGNIVVELSQVIIYFFLFLCSSLSLWLKSEHPDTKHDTSMKLPYLLPKNSQDVLNVHKLEF